jgi:hypothetical protein
MQRRSLSEGELRRDGAAQHSSVPTQLPRSGQRHVKRRESRRGSGTPAFPTAFMPVGWGERKSREVSQAGNPQRNHRIAEERRRRHVGDDGER